MTTQPHRPLLPTLRCAAENAATAIVQTAEVRAALDALTRCVTGPFPAGEQNPSVRPTWIRAELALIKAEFLRLGVAA